MENSELIVSGERLTPGKSSKRNQEDHTARYEFSLDYIKGKTVLDIACGTGYGAKLIKDAGALEVVGVDIDKAAIDYAVENFSAAGVTFICASADNINFPAEKFDTIVTFETIEHLEEPIRKAYLEKLKNSLKKDGLIILSTPNKLITSPWSIKPLNPYHVLEYYKKTLAEEINLHGLYIEAWYGQRFVKTIFTKYPVYILVRIVEKILKKSFGIYDIADSAKVRKVIEGTEPRYFIVLIKK
jgi:O-antigen biosynthesis protein